MNNNTVDKIHEIYIELDKLYDILNKNDNKALALLHHDVISYWNKLNDLLAHLQNPVYASSLI